MPSAKSHPTSDALIDAGLQLTEECGLSQMTVDAIVQRAGVAKGTFYVHFRDRAAYLVAVHRRFHDALRARIAEATQSVPPGAEHLRLGTIAYLDGCLKARGVKGLLFEARGERAIAEEVRRSDARFSRGIEASFAAMGHPGPAESSRLLVAMCAETAIAELAAGRPCREMRRALFRFAGLEETRPARSVVAGRSVAHANGERRARR